MKGRNHRSSSSDSLEGITDAENTNAASARWLRRGVKRRIGIDLLARAAQHLTNGATTAGGARKTHDRNIPALRRGVNAKAQSRCRQPGPDDIRVFVSRPGVEQHHAILRS